MSKLEVSILIPTFNCDCSELVAELSRQAESINGLHYEIIVADDGSTDRALTEQCSKIATLPYTQFIDQGVNIGRAAIRNFLAKKTRYQWLIFLDSDMTIPNGQFLTNYLDSGDEQIVYGGYVVGKGEPSNLRYIYEKKVEPKHRPEERRKRPFQHFHTSNFLISRNVMLTHPFDERFRNYGYEDVFFGKQLQRAGYTITHIDNPAGFYTFESNASFMDKTEEGLRTLYKFRNDLRGYSVMLTFTENIHLRCVRWLIRLWHKLFGGLERLWLCSSHPNLKIFEIYKLGYFLSIKN